MEIQIPSSYILSNKTPKIKINVWGLNFKTTSPGAKLEVAGGIKLANDTATCDASKAGTIRWTETAFQGCDGTAWTSLSFAKDGTTQSRAGDSCKVILDNGFSTNDGVYWIDPDGDGDTSDAFQAYCKMTFDGGGWTLVAQHVKGSGNVFSTGAVGTLVSPTQGTSAKLSDAIWDSLISTDGLL